jgi:hypothetical protein
MPQRRARKVDLEGVEAKQGAPGLAVGECEIGKARPQPNASVATVSSFALASGGRTRNPTSAYSASSATGTMHALPTLRTQGGTDAAPTMSMHKTRFEADDLVRFYAQSRVAGARGMPSTTTRQRAS